MGISDILEIEGINLGGAGNYFGLISNIVFFLIFLAIFAGFALWWLDKKSYNKTIHKFEEINGTPCPIGVDLAKEISLPNTSVRALYLRKAKMFLPRPSLQTGQGHYWYFIRGDGEWVNIRPQNVNVKLQEMGMMTDHSDMRLANASLKKLIDRMYKKSNWLKEWAPYLGMMMMIIMLSIGGYMVFGKAGEVSAGNAEVTKQSAELVKEVARLLSSVENIKATSGIRPVT